MMRFCGIYSASDGEGMGMVRSRSEVTREKVPQ